MKFIEPEAHKHKFTTKGSKKVAVHKVEGNGATQTASDVIQFRKCECGKTKAYDLERTLV